MLIRLNKYISHTLQVSRRQADTIIFEKRLTINGNKDFDIGYKVNVNTDKVCFQGKELKYIQTDYIYIILNKPVGYLCTTRDDLGRPTIFDLIKLKNGQRIFYVGRLDFYTEGLLLLTNNGKFANKIMHPSSEVSKIYIVGVNRCLNEKIVDRLTKGIKLYEGIAKFNNIKLLYCKNNKYYYNIELKQGFYRQIRRMLIILKIKVNYLKRTHISKLGLGNLSLGKYIEISEKTLQRYGLIS